MSLKKSQKNLLIHSEIKVKLLNAYLEKYFNVLNNVNFIGDIHYYDMFCSEGIYENGGKGSPILALESIIKAYNFAKKVNRNSGKFHCFYNDKEENKILKLKNHISAINLPDPENIEIEFSSKDYRDILPEVINKVNNLKKNERAFVFIDPYGYKNIRISDIKNLMLNNNVEVLLFLPTHHMFRFIEGGTPISLYEFTEEIFSDIKRLNNITGLEFIENLKDGFKNYLGNGTFVDSFVISREKNQFYCLFFFTNHIYGFDRMLESKWEIDEEEGRGWKYNSEEENLFSFIDKSPDTYKFENKLKEFIKNPKSNKDIYYFTLINNHLPKHTNDILKKWQNENLIDCKTLDGNNARKSAFYLSYNYYRNSEPIKVFINLK